MTAQATPYLPVGLPLPYYARTDLAYRDAQYLGAAPAGLIYSTTSPGGALEYVTYAAWTIVTSATVGARYPNVRFLSAFGGELWRVPASDPVPESSTAALTMLVGIGSSFASGASYVIVVPPTVLEPGAALRFDCLNFQATDQITALSFDRILVPTGPEIDTRVEAVAPIRLA